MKKQVKNFRQYLNESRMTQVQIDFGYGTLEEMAAGLAELAQLAPNCEVVSTNGVKGDYMDITIAGPSDECKAVSDYWNDLRGGRDIYTSPHGMDSTLDMAANLLKKRQDRERPRFN